MTPDERARHADADARSYPSRPFVWHDMDAADERAVERARIPWLPALLEQWDRERAERDNAYRFAAE